MLPVSTEPTEVSAWTWTRAWAPSAETVEDVPVCTSPKGAETMATPSMSAALLAKVFTASAWPPISPSEAVKRTCSLVPAACGRRSVRISRPSMDSVPEMVKVSVRRMPTVLTAPPRMAMRRSQAARTRGARRAHQRPRECR